MPKQKKYIVSACLIGKACFYDGSSRCVPEMKELFDSGVVIALCPEELAGFKAPRPPIEIFAGAGEDVLKGKAYIFNKEGKDVTINIIKGSKEFLKIAQDSGVSQAVLKARSPCCGKGNIYDGTFNGKLRKGNGVTAALLLKNGFEVVTDEEFLKRHRTKKTTSKSPKR
ncbi:MAG: DUF523 domain-containing protein [Candidatus Omnitrophica bacterium]|nr:DUF523 domain-containing protein [Candidatus Omnitrophota bacterium]